MMSSTDHPPSQPTPGRRRGSVLVIVLVTLVVATTALLLFIEKASTDLLVHVRDADRINLRQEAYSALETTLAVLVEFESVLGGLHSPAEGWSEPLEWGDYEPAEGREVTVSFVDESGRLPFRSLDFAMWVRLFESWEVSEQDAERWADALLGWSQEEYTPATFDAPRAEDYARDPLGFVAPGRTPHSMSELRAIDVIRDAFFDESGQPNDYYHRFEATVSLLNYRSPNINAAPTGALAALGQYDDNQQELLGDYLGGRGVYRSRGVGYFSEANEVATVLGEGAVAAGFGARIQALRINVEVRQGNANYTLSVVVAPSNGGAVPNTSDPIPSPPDDGEGNDEEESNERKPIISAAALAIAGPGGEDELPESIDYPFTLLSIQEMGGQPATAAPAEM
jgi:general secretion pathway protein K